MNTKRILLTSLLAAMYVTGCDDHDHDHDHEGEGLFVEICEHLADGPIVELTAGGGPATAPAAEGDHRRFDITLSEGSGGMFEGAVQREFGAGDYVIAVSQDLPVTVTQGDGTVVPPHHELGRTTDCEDVANSWHFEMPAGTHIVTFGPSAVQEVSVVFEEGGHE